MSLDTVRVARTRSHHANKDATLYTSNGVQAFQLHTMGVNATDLKVGDVIVMGGLPHAMRRRLAKLSEVPNQRWMDGGEGSAGGHYVTTTARR